MTKGSGAPALGMDLIEIERIERAIARRPRLAERLFRPGELAYAEGHSRPARHLAARFAAKEATIKALGGGCAPFDIEVVGSSPPRLLLHGGARRLAEAAGVDLAVSLTHSREVAGAVVLASPSAA